MEQDEVVVFLLKHPPLDEIGGPLVDTIDLYRNKCITKKQAITIIKKDYESFINKYIKQAAIIFSSVN